MTGRPVSTGFMDSWYSIGTEQFTDGHLQFRLNKDHVPCGLLFLLRSLLLTLYYHAWNFVARRM